MSSIALFPIHPRYSLSLTVNLSLPQRLWISTLLRMFAMLADIFPRIVNILVREAGPVGQALSKGSHTKTQSTHVCCWRFSTTKRVGSVEDPKMTSVLSIHSAMRTIVIKVF